MHLQSLAVTGGILFCVHGENMWFQVCGSHPAHGPLLVLGITGPWRKALSGSLGWLTVAPARITLVHFQIGSHTAAKSCVLLYSSFPVPDVWSQKQPLPPNAVQVDKTVAEPESLKKLLIIWLMCIRLWECEINHQPWDELLKWILVFCLLSLGNGFSFLQHGVSRCKAAAFRLSQSQEQPVARPGLASVLLHEQFTHGVLPMQNVLAPGNRPGVTGPDSTVAVFQMSARVHTHALHVHSNTQPVIDV